MSRDVSDRAHHFLRILDEGKRFTMELLKENEALRLANLKLKDDLREREEQLKRSDAYDYERALAQAQKERDAALEKLEDLRAHLASVEAQNRELTERFVRIERQNGHLASLYVATYNLHSTLQLSEVVDYLREIIINLIGSETFGIYVVSDDGAALTLLAQEGLDGSMQQSLARDELVEHALRTGRAVALEANDDTARAGAIACAPLVIHREALGVIAIYRLVDHKTAFEAIDRELLDMLAGHAATAIYSARLYAQSSSKLPTLERFLDLVRSG